MTVSLSATHKLPIDPFPRVQAVCLSTMAQARYWLDDLINGEDYRHEDRRLTLTSGIIIDSPQLNLVLATNAKEAIDERYHRQNLQFRRGPWHEQPKADPTPRQPKAAKPDRVKRPDGYVTVAEIAAELGVQPFDIRQALRNSGAKKPEYGWSFSAEEVKAVKKLVGGKS